MSLITKIAIVFLVLLSIMMTAGVVVFVNRVENYKTTNAALTGQLSAAQAQKSAAVNEAVLQKQYADDARKSRDLAYADSAKTVADRDKKISDLNAQLADQQSAGKTMQLAADNMTAALTASETARAAQAAILDSTRKDNNDLAVKYSQSQLAISDLTNKLEVATRLLTNSTETVAELKQAKERDDQIINDAKLNVGEKDQTGLEGGAPPINAVVRSTRMINGIPYATISVGADAQVKVGMKFNVIDRDKKEFLGELTVGQVDEKEATGKLEGPHIDEVKSGIEVRTQL